MKKKPGYQEGGTVVEEMESEEMVEAPVETPEAPAQGDANVSTLTFDEYAEQGVPQELVDQGNALAQTLQALDTADPNATEEFSANIQEFIRSLEMARNEGDLDAETMRALKEMSNDAMDLQAAMQTIQTEAAAMNNVENNPNAVLAMTGEAEEEIEDEAVS